MKLLIVEDDPIAGRMLHASLRQLGHEPLLLPSAEAALDCLRTHPLRLVIADWRLDGLDGMSLCRQLRQGDQLDYTYFILVTTAALDDAAYDAAREAGVDDFLAKPVAPRDLKLRLHTAERILGFTTQIRRLESFVPICGHCKRVRDDHDYWQQLEAYFAERSGAKFSHGICPECYETKLVPQFTALGITPPPRPTATRVLPRQ